MAGTLRAIATRSAKYAVMEPQIFTVIGVDVGLAGDGARKPGSAVSILSWEKWQAACAALGADLPWTFRRANLLVAGIPLMPEKGRRISIGSALLEITGETDPCRRMDDQHMGLMAALKPDARGGVRCMVIEGGAVALGDAVHLL